MKKIILKSALAKLVLIVAISTTTVLSAQNQSPAQVKIEQENKSTVVHASSLREMYGYSDEGRENNLDVVLSLYYDIKYAHIVKDPALKEKLVYEFLDDLRENGYKVPKKVKAVDYFEPFNFILDMKVYFNKAGVIIPADQIGKGLTTYAGK